MHSHRAEGRPMRRRFLGLLSVLLLATGLAACAPGQGYDPLGGSDRRIISAVTFDFDSYRIRPEAFPALDNTATALNDPALAGLLFEINGHTDVVGRFGYNVALSSLRAGAVVQYLAARGVPQERMRAQGFGPLQLLDPYNPRDPGNRRVEIVARR